MYCNFKYQTLLAGIKPYSIFTLSFTYIYLTYQPSHISVEIFAKPINIHTIHTLYYNIPAILLFQKFILPKRNRLLTLPTIFASIYCLHYLQICSSSLFQDLHLLIHARSPTVISLPYIYKYRLIYTYILEHKNFRLHRLIVAKYIMNLYESI